MGKPLPAAELSFNETSGTTASDVTGNGSNGTLTGGPGWVAGHSGNAVDLSGTSQYVALPAGVVSSANTITITAWVNLDTITKWARIFDFGSGTSQYMFLTPKNDAATGVIRFGIKNGGTEQSINGTAALATGGWHHVAVTLDGTTGTIYVDGQQAASGNINIRPSQLGVTTQNWIGRSQFPDPYLDGRVDDFRIYNMALTAQEVTAVMNE